MLFFSAAASNCVKGRETRKQPLALHRYKTSLIWSWCSLLLPFPPPTLVLCIPVAQNLLASPSPDFKTYNTRSSLNTWEGRTLLFPPPLINIQQKHQSLSRSLRLHGCSSPCHKAVCTRLCARGCVYEALCTRLCVRGCVHEALCTRLCVRGCVYVPPAQPWMSGHSHVCVSSARLKFPECEEAFLLTSRYIFNLGSAAESPETLKKHTPARWEAAVYMALGAQLRALWWPKGVAWGRRREAHEGEDVCIHTADSHCCTAETNNTVEQLHSSFNFNFFKIKTIYTYYICPLMYNVISLVIDSPSVVDLSTVSFNSNCG